MMVYTTFTFIVKQFSKCPPQKKHYSGYEEKDLGYFK